MNEALTDEPGLVNTSAEANGWMAKVKLSDPSELESLMVPDSYPQLVDPEALFNPPPKSELDSFEKLIPPMIRARVVTPDSICFCMPAGRSGLQRFLQGLSRSVHSCMPSGRLQDCKIGMGL